MHRLHELRKRCRRYYFKRRLLYLFPLVLLGAGLLWYGEQLQRDLQGDKSRQKETSRTFYQTKRSKKTLFSLQIGAYRLDAAKTIAKTKEKLKKLGIDDCFVIRKPQRGLAYLRCGCVQKKEELNEYKKIVQQGGFDYLVVQNGCPSKKKEKRRVKALAQPLASEPSKKPQTSQKQQLIEATQADLKDLQKLFEQRKSYDLAYTIARRYYNQKEYDKAIEWAKRANKLDASKPQAWIVYAKSLHALGKKEQAKKILRFYLKFNNDATIKELVRKWSHDL